MAQIRGIALSPSHPPQTHLLSSAVCPTFLNATGLCYQCAHNSVVVQLLSHSDVPYGCLTRTAPALLLSAETLLIFADIRTITM